jgi:hypothetical protein
MDYLQMGYLISEGWMFFSYFYIINFYFNSIVVTKYNFHDLNPVELSFWSRIWPDLINVLSGEFVLCFC